MNYNSVDLDGILDTVRAIAWETMKILRFYYQGEMEAAVQKKDGPVTQADLAANCYILENLQAKLGTETFGYLSEETHAGSEPFPQDWVWIIDPLDGTKDFIDKTGEYALHIALSYKQHPVLAIVGVPEADKLYYAVKDQGCFVESADGEIKRLQVTEPNPEQLTLVVSRTHRDQRFQNLIEQMPFQNRHYVGSVGLKIVAILEQQADVYLSLSGKSAAKDWDFAAPELILTEAGGKFTYFNQEPVLYNRGDVSQWGGIIASNGPLHETLGQEAIAILAELDQA